MVMSLTNRDKCESPRTQQRRLASARDDPIQGAPVYSPLLASWLHQSFCGIHPARRLVHLSRRALFEWLSFVRANNIRVELFQSRRALHFGSFVQESKPRPRAPTSQ